MQITHLDRVILVWLVGVESLVKQTTNKLLSNYQNQSFYLSHLPLSPPFGSTHCGNNETKTKTYTHSHMYIYNLLLSFPIQFAIVHINFETISHGNKILVIFKMYFCLFHFLREQKYPYNITKWFISGSFLLLLLYNNLSFFFFFFSFLKFVFIARRERELMNHFILNK
jgi:hypothetical protein